MTLTVGGLFSGIGGIELGLQRAGMRVLWHCEQDPYCQQVLERHWPGVPCYPDVTTLKGEDVAPVDVLCGGFPCQDLSVAGKGAGLAGARSGLWSEYARLIRELRPRYVVVENVPALLGRGLGTVVGDLAALGYDAEWDCVPAAAVGAPHLRDRVWLVAYPNGVGVRHSEGVESWGAGEAVATDDGAPRPVADPDGVRELQPQGRVRDLGGRTDDRRVAVAVADADCERRCEGLQRPAGTEQRPGAGDAEWSRSLQLAATSWPAEPDVGRVVDGLPDRVDRERGLGNAVVPQIPELIGRRILAWEGASA